MLVVLVLVLAARAEGEPAPALWGGLEAGPYAVGFRQIEVRDPGRPFWLPRRARTHPSPSP